MKIQTLPIVGLVALAMAAFGSRAQAGIFSSNIDMLVVAEKANGPQPTASTYAVFDGGYIEAGDAIAGDTPPTAAQVSNSLRAALANQGFAPSSNSPAVVLTYHWGVLRIDHVQIRVPYGIKTNLMARIELVSTEQLGAEVENHILLREKGTGTNDAAASPAMLIGPTKTVVDQSRQPRIFVIVSAYDYQGLLHREAQLLWRVKLSAREQSGEMDQVIPALLTGGGPYFGKNLPNVQTIEVTPRAAPATGESAAAASAGALHLDAAFINGLLKSEHDNFSGGSSGPS
jgi:hypothetical protein